MKNNIITSSQFYFSAFLSTLASLLFIDVSSSYQQIIYIALAVIINMAVILFYKGNKNLFVDFILSIYYFIISLIVLNRMVVFMSSAIKSGPYWVLVLIICTVIFFCSTKGFEALTRSAVIITFFVAIFLLYILASSVSGLEIQPLNFNATTSIEPALILLFPTAVYTSLNQTIKDSKKYPLFIYTAGTVLSIGYLVFIASPINNVFPLNYLAKKLHIGIFKGCDFLLLSIFTISIIFFISTSIQCVVKNSFNKLYHGGFLLFLSLCSLVSLYIEEIKGIVFSTQLQTVLTICMLTAVIINSLFNRRKIPYKICNKSKKS